MRRITRISIILLVIGVSFLLVTVMRGSSQYGNMTLGGAGVTTGRWDLYQDYFFPSRTLSLEINSNVTADVFILDQASIDLYNLNRTISPVASLTNVKHDLAVSEINARGAYGILIHNASNETGNIKATVTLYGFEKDLLYASVSIISVGFLVLISSFIIKSAKETPLPLTKAEKTVE